jgi:hypothetical protein
MGASRSRRLGTKARTLEDGNVYACDEPIDRR